MVTLAVTDLAAWVQTWATAPAVRTGFDPASCGPVWWDTRKRRWCFAHRQGNIVEFIYLRGIGRTDRTAAEAARTERITK